METSWLESGSMGRDARQRNELECSVSSVALCPAFCWHVQLKAVCRDDGKRWFSGGVDDETDLDSTCGDGALCYVLCFARVVVWMSFVMLSLDSSHRRRECMRSCRPTTTAAVHRRILPPSPDDDDYRTTTASRQVHLIRCVPGTPPPAAAAAAGGASAAGDRSLPTTAAGASPANRASRQPPSQPTQSANSASPRRPRPTPNEQRRPSSLTDR